MEVRGQNCMGRDPQYTRSGQGMMIALAGLKGFLLRTASRFQAQQPQRQSMLPYKRRLQEVQVIGSKQMQRPSVVAMEACSQAHARRQAFQ